MAFFPVEQDIDKAIHDKLRTRNAVITKSLMDSNINLYMSGEAITIGEITITKSEYPSNINLNVTWTDGSTTYHFAKLGTISDADMRTFFQNASIIVNASAGTSGTRISLGAPVMYGAVPTGTSTDRMPLSYSLYLIKTSSSEWSLVSSYFSSTSSSTFSLKSKVTMFFSTRVLNFDDLQ